MRTMHAFALVLLVAAATGGLTAPQPRPCAGDCNGDGRVAIEEIVTGVALALGEPRDATCLDRFCFASCGPGPAIGRPSIACLIAAVDALLEGCPGAACVADADCDDGNGCSFDTCTAGGCVSTCVCV